MSIIDTAVTGLGKQSVTTDATVALEDANDVGMDVIELQPLVAHINDRFQRSKDRRHSDEQRWLEAYRNFRGIYGPDVAFTDEEKSQVFVKVTKTKVLAGYAQICDVLFAGNTFPIGIESTPVPEGEGVDPVHIEFNPQAAQTSTSLTTRPELAALLRKEIPKQVQDKVKEGVGHGSSVANYYPADESAKRMEKKIHDQLVESNADKHLRFMAFEMSLFGTGIMKGPFAIDKEYPKWDIEESVGDKGKPRGVYNPTIKTIPKVNSVSVWDFYPDADAHNMEECEYVVQRHKMSAHQLRQLKKRPAFRSDMINLALEYGFDYQPEYWEDILEDHSSHTQIERYEVLEYWGMVSRETAETTGLDIPEELDEVEEFQINAWICNNVVLRCVLNPYTPTHIPYYATPYELNPYSFFGVGVAENMNDTQLIMNGVMRMAIDNLALSGNIIFEVNETNLEPGQDMKLYPGKVFRTNGAPGQSIFSQKFQNVTNELLMMYDKARQLTDEATSMPSYAHGGIGIQGMGRTAAGMSMLMGAASHTIKAVVRNIDDYFLAPIGRNIFAFNMQFDFDPTIKGDLAVYARGTESLMRNEVRSERLLQFLQTGTANPATAPLVKVDYILRELAASLDLDADKVVNDTRAMMIQADIIKQMSEAMGVNTKPTGQQASTGAPTPGGNTPTPDTQGFTGNGPRPGINGQPQQPQENRQGV